RDNWLKLLCRSGPMLLKPIAKALIRHKLAELAKLCIERLTVDRDVMHHQVRDWVIAGFTVHTGFPSNDPKLSHGHRKVTPKCNCDNQISYHRRTSRRGGRWLQRGVRRRRTKCGHRGTEASDRRAACDIPSCDVRRAVPPSRLRAGSLTVRPGSA